MPAENRRGFPLRQTVLLSTLVFAATCGGGATEGGSDPGMVVTDPVTLSITPNFIGATQGTTRLATVTFTRTGATNQTLTLSATGLSAGVTATFNPATFTTVTGSSQLTITTATDALVKTDTLIVKANGPEITKHTEVGVTAVALIVSPPQVSVSRNGTGLGTVTSSPAGINCGSICSAGFPYGSSVTLTATPSQASAFAGWSGGCSGTATTCTLTSGSVPTPPIATFNSTAPNFSMSVAPTTATVPQGGATTAIVSLVRINGFAAVVNISVSGAPAGLTVTPNPAAVTGDASTLNISAALSVAAGTYPLTVTAAAGIGTQTSTLNVQVAHAPGGTGDVAVSFATCDPSTVPVWFAAQSGNGAWTRLTLANNAVAFTPGATGGFAYVTPDGTGFRTQVVFGTASEFLAIANGPGPCFSSAQIGTKRVTGTMSHVNSAFQTTVGIGGSEATLGQFTNSYSLPNVPAGKRDLYAVESSTAGTDVVLQRMVVRRNVNYGNNAPVPDIDVIGAESFAPDKHVASINNLSGDQSVSSVSLVTANGQSFEFYSGVGRFFQANNKDGVFEYGVPDSLLQPGDFHLATVFAAVPNGNSARFAESILHTLADYTVSLGSALSTPSVTTLTASPYLRLHAQWAFQTEYGDGADVEYDQGLNSIEIATTAGYLGANKPANWIVDVPDFTGTSYDPSWGLHGGATASWAVTAAHGNVLALFGAPMVDGTQVVGALAASDAASFDRLGFSRRRSRTPSQLDRRLKPQR